MVLKLILKRQQEQSTKLKSTFSDSLEMFSPTVSVSWLSIRMFISSSICFKHLQNVTVKFLYTGFLIRASRDSNKSVFKPSSRLSG